MVRQRVVGTQGCSQIPLVISLELPVPENSELWCWCFYTFLHVVFSQVAFGIKYTMNIQTQSWPGLLAQALCSENMVIFLLGWDQV